MAKTIFIFSKFNRDDEIITSAISIDGNHKNIDIFKPQTGITLEKAESRLKTISEIFHRSLSNEVMIICNDFKRHIKALKLDKTRAAYNVYQINCPPEIEDSLLYIQQQELLPYQKVLANSQVVYQSLEDNGIFVNYEHIYPKYSTETFTNRSKSKGFNIQGYTENDHIRTPFAGDNDVLILFDWVSADLRVASILSQDINLIKSFKHSDPYTYMTEMINEASDSKITREECKTYLLKSINSMDWSSTILNDIYPQLMRWIKKSSDVLDSDQAYLRTLLGKTLSLDQSKNKLAVLNGSMQGSVAHAMQLTLIKLYDIIPHQIVCDIHDSLVVNAPNDPNKISSVINTVANVMKRPFSDILPDDYVFPIKVSIGTRWKKWKYCKTIR